MNCASAPYLRGLFPANPASHRPIYISRGDGACGLVLDFASNYLVKIALLRSGRHLQSVLGGAVCMSIGQLADASVIG
jgi:hypothetical protein